jgi:hypothetical protein
MRYGLVLLCVLGACGSKTKTEATGPQTVKGAGDGSSNDDLRIPKVDSNLCDTKGKKVAIYDLNHDDKPDVWKLYLVKEEKGGAKVEILTCKQMDFDHDGDKDKVEHFAETGAITLEDYDFDFDGKFDARVHYDTKTGNKYLVERVTGFSGKVDTWEKYDGDQKLESLRRDRNGDTRPDYWEQYRAGKLEKILYDDDFDGKVDRQDETKQPPPIVVPEVPTGEPTSAPASAPASAPVSAPKVAPVSAPASAPKSAPK